MNPDVLSVFAPVEQRTEQGLLLRAALDEVDRVVRESGKRYAAVVLVDGEGVEVGFARHDIDGWEISAAVKAGVKRGRFSGVHARIEASW